MQEKVDKYIYKVNETKYRVKFLKVDKKQNIKIIFDQYIIGTLDEAKKLRNIKLEENGLSLERIIEKKDIFGKTEETIKKTKKRKNSNNIKNISSNPDKVDKYIYEIDKGKKYRVFIRKGGSNGQKGDYFSSVFDGTLAQARKFRDKKLAELKLKNGKGDKGNIKFIEFARIYYKEYAEKELSPTTVTSGKNELKNYVLPEIANVSLNKIDALTIQKIINNLKVRDKERADKNGNITKLSITSVNNVYRLLRKILNKAIAWDYIDTNPVNKVKAPGVSKKEKQSYNREELLNILEILQTEDQVTETIFTIAICTGLRRGEIAGIHLEDIDLNNNLISVKRAVVWDSQNKRILEKETKTKGSVRDVPIPLFCSEIIKEYLKLRERMIKRYKKKNDNYISPRNLFLSKYGGIIFPDSLSSKWLDFRNRHKEIKNVSLHGLRHSYCSMQMNENPNLSPVDVKKLMGHSQLTTTYIYTHSNEDKTDDAISVFDKYYNVNGERKVNLNLILSLYTQKPFVPTSEIIEAINFVINDNKTIDDKYNIIKEYIDSKYPAFKKVDISNININNVWDWLSKLKTEYGDEFILSPIE